MFHNNDPFIRMTAHALAGGFLGLVAGLLFGLLIQLITSFLPVFSMMEEGPHQIAPFLGMGFGSLVGALLGGAVGLKK